MICKKCGTNNESNTGKCINCGAKLSASKSSMSSVIEFSASSFIMLAFSIIAVIFLVIPNSFYLDEIAHISDATDLDYNYIEANQTLPNEKLYVSDMISGKRDKLSYRMYTFDVNSYNSEYENFIELLNSVRTQNEYPYDEAKLNNHIDELNGLKKQVDVKYADWQAIINNPEYKKIYDPYEQKDDERKALESDKKESEAEEKEYESGVSAEFAKLDKEIYDIDNKIKEINENSDEKKQLESKKEELVKKQSELKEDYQKHVKDYEKTVKEIDEKIKTLEEEIAALKVQLQPWEIRIAPVVQALSERVKTLQDRANEIVLSYNAIRAGALGGVVHEHNTSIKPFLSGFLTVMTILLIISFALTIVVWFTNLYGLRIITAISSVVISVLTIVIPLSVWTLDYKWDIQKVGQYITYGIRVSAGFSVVLLCSVATLITGLAYISSQLSKD